MTTRKLLSILLCFALLFSLSACQEEPKPVRPDPPADWDEFLGRIINLETQTFHLPDGDIWYDTAQDVLDYLELTEDNADIRTTSDKPLNESTQTVISPHIPTSFTDLDISYTGEYTFLWDRMWYETIMFNNLTAADMEFFLESFQPIAQQITCERFEYGSTVDEFVQTINDSIAFDPATLPEGEQPVGNRVNIVWTDEDYGKLGVTCAIQYNEEMEQVYHIGIELQIDRDIFYENIGVEVASRTTFSEKPVYIKTPF